MRRPDHPTTTRPTAVNGALPGPESPEAREALEADGPGAAARGPGSRSVRFREPEPRRQAARTMRFQAPPPPLPSPPTA
ncbi:hypothetical protein ABMX48_33415 [Streptomyces cavourensis]